MPEGRALIRSVLVIPCYNEANRFREADYSEALKNDPTLGLLFVDDGSRDATAKVLKTFARRFPEQVALYSLPVNRGKAEAVREGVQRLFQKTSDQPWKGEELQFFGYWDADLATPFGEFKRFLEVFSTSPHLLLVMGARVNLLGRQIKRRAIRHYLGRVFATAASMVLNLPVYDTQCGAKIFRYCPTLGRLFERPFVSGWIFDVELLARLVSSLKPEVPSTVIYELPLLEWEDVAGSKIKGRDFLKASLSLFRIARLYPRVSSH